MIHSCVWKSLVSTSRTACNAANKFQIQIRTVTALQEPTIIRIPVKMKEKLHETNKKRKSWNREKIVHQSRKGKESELIISCKRRELNHYMGQSYSKFREVPLASKGWSHRKSVGDYFTINSYRENPAFAYSDDVSQLDFESVGLSKDMTTQIAKLGFARPTNIQALTIPHVLEGKNTLITAETGNGKTLAYIAPMLQQIAKYKKSFHQDFPFNTPLGLIIVPGRELAEQIQAVAHALCDDMGINVELVVGGRTKKLTLNPKMSQVHLLVATIGALSKLTTAGVYNIKLVKHIVLDEADSLLDDSFNENVIRYMHKFPIQGGTTEDGHKPLVLSGVQLTLVSATMPRSLNSILSPLVDLDSLAIISTPYLHCVMPHVPQQFFRVNYSTKAEKLLEMCRSAKAKGTPMIIFSNNSKASDWVSLFLNANGISCININGNMNARLREGRFQTFQRGQVIALSCTDLASRGLDTIRAGHIINFEFPTFISDYIHRCGRTGRAGSSVNGLVTSLVVHRKEIELVKKIEYAARKMEEFHNVNANITRILESHAAKWEERATQ